MYSEIALASSTRARAWDNTRRPKRCLLQRDGELREVVAARLVEGWSPEQISGWLKAAYPERKEMRVSHETNYRSLFIQARGVLAKELTAHLRRRRTMRRSKKASAAGLQRGRIRDAVSIRERPAELR
ncbi:hypothetical protein [Actinomadura chibensis]|uniref:hypothetical protein n=1 Tax=Actinomadura chibensis TaxID=392828 RepID=UPI0008338E9A|nr:hypothetical protein [Actinomadura chibensis]